MWELLSYQTAVASRSWLLFLNGDSMGSPMMRLARRLPAKMTTMEEAQQDRGCLRLNWMAPGMTRRQMPLESNTSRVLVSHPLPGPP